MALTAGKAKKMLDDGTVHGRGLTDKQKRYFGAIAGGATPMKKINGGWLDKYAMGGSLPGASGMMYARSNTPPPLYTQSEMKAKSGGRCWSGYKAVSGKTPFSKGSCKKAQDGDEIQLDEVVVTAPGRKKDTAFRDSDKDGNVVSRFLNTGRGRKRKELFEDMPEFMQVNDDGEYTLDPEQMQRLKNLGITNLDEYNDYFGTVYNRDNALNEFNYLNTYKPARDELISSIHGATNEAAKNIMMASSFIPIVRGASMASKVPQAYRYLANSPVGRAASKYVGQPFRRFTNYKPGGGPFSIGNYADAASVGYGGYNIAPDVKELYNNPSWSAAGNVGLDMLSLTPLLNKRFTGPIKNTLLPNLSRDLEKAKNFINAPIVPELTNPLSNFRTSIGQRIERFKTQGNFKANPFWKGFNENPVPSAAKFEQQWMSAPGFSSRYDDMFYRHQDPALLRSYRNIQNMYNSALTNLKIRQPALFTNNSNNINYFKETGTANRILQDELSMPLTQIAKVFPALKTDAELAIKLKQQQIGIGNTLAAARNASMNLDQIQATGKFTKVFDADMLSPDDLKFFSENPKVMGFFRNSENRAIINIDKIKEYYGKNPEKVSAYMRSILGHENLHAIEAGGRASRPLYGNTTRAAIPEIVDDGKNVLTGVTQKSIDKVWKGFMSLPEKRREFVAYLTEPTEVAARIKELRMQFIPKKFLGTDKQYEMPTKLLNKIISEGKKGNTAVDPAFFKLIQNKEAFRNLFKVLPAAAPIAVGASQQKTGGNVQKAQDGTILSIAQRLADNKTDGLRPALSAVDKLKAIFKGEDGCVKDNTCVQVVKEIVNEAAFDNEGQMIKGAPYIPESVYNNRAFRKNHSDYGFVEIEPEDGGERFREDELRPGDILQYYYNKDSEGVKEGDSYIGFPYHLGVYEELDQYISDGDQEHPTERHNMYIDSDGNKKDPFYVYRPKKMKDGGWLDKYEVIEDDMGQLTNPGKITKINSNNITMKGVNYPVLGVSDTGDTKVMQPGVENYKYDGNSVTEYPMAQTGLKTKTATPSFPYINRVPDTSPQVDFLKDWTNSTRGQELLSNSFDGDEKDIEKLTYKRINNLDNVDFSIDDHADDFLGRYNRNRHDIKLNSSLLDTSEPKLIGNQDKDVVLHELSHAQDFSPGAEFNRITIPFSDQKLINKYRKRTIKDTKKLDAPRKVRRDIKDRVNYIGDPTETRARLNSIRYFYETSPIGKEEGMPSIFDSEVTSDMMEVMKDNEQFRELQEVYSDEEILELLNTVSDNSKSSGPSNMAYAKQGRSLVTLDQLTNFTNYNTPQPGGWLDKY